MKSVLALLLAAGALLGPTTVWAQRPALCVPQQATPVLTTDPGLQLLARMEESAGVRADSSGHDNHLSPVGSPAGNADHQEGALSLDLIEASSQYLERSSANLSAGFPGRTGGANGALTIAGWVRTKSVGNHPLVIESDGNQRSWTVWVWNFGAGPVIDPNIFNSAGGSFSDRGVADFRGNTVLQIGQWYHFAYTYDGATGLSRVYVNGALDAGPFNENMTTYFRGTAPLRIGFRPGFGANSTYADVRLDEVVVLDRVLSPAEVAAVHQYGAVPPIVCDDGNPCNGQETCDPTLGCQAGAPLDCDDGDACTADTCDPDAGCVNVDDPSLCGVSLDLLLTTLVSERTQGRRDGTVAAQGYLADANGAFVGALLAGGVSVRVTGAGSVADAFGWTALNCGAHMGPFGPLFVNCTARSGSEVIRAFTLLPTGKPDLFFLNIAAIRRPIPRTLTTAPVTVEVIAGSIAAADTAATCRVFGASRRTSVCY